MGRARRRPPRRRAGPPARASDVTVCLNGETGTGKEVVARASTAERARATRPFVVFDCGAIRRGPDRERAVRPRAAARSPARDGDATGPSSAADGGTLFLDEIGELPLALQPQAPARARGARGAAASAATRPRRSTSASSRRPTATSSARSRDGRFRQDLFYRLAVVVRCRRCATGATTSSSSRSASSTTSRSTAARSRASGDARAAILGATVARQRPRAAPPRPARRRPRSTPARHRRRPRPRRRAGRARAGARDPGRAAQAPPRRAGRRQRPIRARLRRGAAGPHGRQQSAAAELAGVTRQAVHRLVHLHGVDRKRFRHGPPEEG